MRLACFLSTVAVSVAFSAPLLAEGEAGHASESVDDLDLVKLLNVEVSTATKTAENLDDAPAVITVITRDDIERWGYESLADVLSHTVGFYVQDDHVLPNAGVRGMSGGQGAESGVIKVMIDGRSVAYRTTSGNWLGIELVPLESVAQIEIIRGPASALYGADAFLGVVNIITLKPDDLRPLRARVGLGFTGTNFGERFDVSSGAQLGKFDLLLGAAGENADRSGLTLPSQSPAPVLPEEVGQRRTTLDLQRRSLVLQGRVGYREPNVGQLVLSAYGSAIERGGDLAHWAQLTSGTSASGLPTGTQVQLGQVRLNLDGLLSVAPGLDLSVQSTYFRGGTLPGDRTEIGSDLFYVKRHESYNGLDSTVEARLIPSGRFNMIAGVEGVYDHEELAAPDRIERATGEKVASEAQATRVDLTNLGAYVSSNLKVLDPLLKLTAGLRYDRHSQYGSELSGRVGVTSRFSRALVSKFLYGSAFKAPSPYLLYATPLRPGDVVGNPGLEPQHVQTAEYELSFRPSSFFAVSSDVSYNWLYNEAEFTPQGINETARNVASQRSLSWETRADVRHYNDYTAYASVELVHSVRDLGQEGYAATLIGTRNVVYPPWVVRAGLTFAVPSLPSVPLELGAEGMLVGPRRADDASLVDAGHDFSLPSYLNLNVSLRTREIYLIPGQETRFALRGRNLLGLGVADPGAAGIEYPLAPPSLYLEIEHMY
jgi:outer membrane receptor for ferrienterochelin and colicins